MPAVPGGLLVDPGAFSGPRPPLPTMAPMPSHMVSRYMYMYLSLFWPDSTFTVHDMLLYSAQYSIQYSIQYSVQFSIQYSVQYSIQYSI